MQNLPSPEEAALLLSKKGLKRLAKQRQPDWQKALDDLRYEQELEALQIELVKLQCWVQETGRRLAILFEGRDAAGKGGAIARFVQHLPPRAIRVVALPKPTDLEKGQWYFQRYTPHLPNPGEMVFFDRSWYNRAVVEPANGFCSDEQYRQFMRQVNDYEHLLYEDGLLLVKFWFDVSKDEQQKRMKQRRTDPLKQWKVSPVDQRAQELWDVYTEFQQRMFQGSHTSYSPWVLVQADSKRRARLESIRYVLAQFEYPGKSQAGTSLVPDPQVVSRYFRS
jgi:polyphosphate kinase 2